MADLSTLDASLPLDTDPASQGASQIRTERADILGWAAVEHALTGPHKFLVGGTGMLPAAGNAGRIYINTDINAIQYDTGSAWVTIGGMPSRTYVSAVGSTTLTGTYADLLTGSISVITGQFVRVEVFCLLGILARSVNLPFGQFRVLMDDVTVLSPGVITVRLACQDSVIFPLIIPAYHSGPSAGAHTFKFQANDANGQISASLKQMMITAF